LTYQEKKINNKVYFIIPNFFFDIIKYIYLLGRVIESYRDKEGLTQAELGKRINVSRLTIINIEKGKGSNTLNILKILKYFDLLHDLDVSFNLMEINLYE